MKISKLLASIALASAASIAAAAPLMLAPTGPGSIGGSFLQSVDGLFIDTFEFTPAVFDGTVAVSLFNVSGTVSFFTASLNGQDFGFFPELGDPVFSFQAAVASSMPLSLTVFGAGQDAAFNFVPGIYRAEISAVSAISPVPEPSTYVMMFIGLAVIGAVAAKSGGRH